MEAIASQWNRAKIDATEEAMNICEKEFITKVKEIRLLQKKKAVLKMFLRGLILN